MNQSPAGFLSEELVMTALSQVDDPEVGINIVDLGLIYGVEMADGRVRVTMTMTTSTCPLHAYITEAARSAVASLPGVESVEVEMVWDPPWKPELMSEAARRQLGR